MDCIARVTTRRKATAARIVTRAPARRGLPLYPRRHDDASARTGPIAVNRAATGFVANGTRIAHAEGEPSAAPSPSDGGSE